MAASVSSEDRLFSLMLALAATREGLLRSDIYATVHGYAETNAAGTDPEAVNRMFERDKKNLRDLGVPIETFDSPDASGNNQLTRYRVNPAALQVPEGVEFTTEELVLLRLAALAWAESSFSLDAQRALLKLAALGENIDGDLIGIAPTISATEPALAPLEQALDQRLVVSFGYRKPGQSVADVRKVEPLALEALFGRWYLISFDQVRGDVRTFMLSRMTTVPKAIKGEFDESHLALVPAARDRMRAMIAEQTATVRVRPGSVAQSMLLRYQQHDAPVQSTDDAQLVEVHYLDEYALAQEIAGFGPDVLVEHPASLRALVIEQLEHLARAHHPVGGQK